MKPQLWLKEDEAAVREAKAQQAIDQAVQLELSEGWQSLQRFIDREVRVKLRELEMSSRDDERNRGAIQALRAISEWPSTTKAIASAELRKHRGT